MSEVCPAPCVVIPCFNHGEALQGVIESLAPFGLSTIIVNDASNAATASILAELERALHWVTVIHRSRNGGKGAAVRDGLVAARGLGYSHALLIDADGQHDVSDIPVFLAEMSRYPEAIILGAPRFGSDAPLARRLGREVSNVIVALSSWRFAARDVLCGFRVYPLSRLIETVHLDRLQSRMGFDAEIVVRALWGGLSIRNIPTRVTYPATGISHFRYGADNFQLARLYARLLVEGLYRGPARMLAPRQGDSRTGAQWFQIAERGSLWGFRLLLRILERIGRYPLFVLMGPIVLHMFVWGGAGRRAAVAFQKELSRVEGRFRSRVALYLRGLRQYWEFGVSIVEKVVSWRDGIPLEKFTWIGRDEVKACLHAGQGVIMMGAHVGNSEVIRAIGENRQVMVNAIMFTANSRHFRALLEEVNEKSFLRVVDISSIDPAIVFDLTERLARGEIVAILSDRLPRNSPGRFVEVPFFGRPARFPEGPWILCSLLGSPVFTAFSMRERGGRYRVEFKRLADQVLLPRARRREALAHYVREYAERLQDIVQRYPFQWFNFYDFWASDAAPPLVTDSPAEKQVERVAP